MFFDNPKIIIYLKANCFQIYKQDKESGDAFDFPPEVVKNQEIFDTKKLKTLIDEYLNNLPDKKQKALLVLGEDIIYEKKLSVETEDLEHQIEDFFNKVPFDNFKLIKKVIKEGNEVRLIAVNKELFESIGDVFEDKGWTILGVVPISIFGIESASALTQDEVSIILKSSDKIQKGDLLHESGIGVSVDGADGYSHKTIFMTGFLLLILLGILGAGAFFAKDYFKITIPGFSSPLTSTPEPQPTESPTPTQDPSTLDNPSKEFLKVQILNGSGIRGQAATIQEVLVVLGYKDIETGNADESGLTETAVVVSKNVGADIQQELTEKLGEIFDKVNLTVSPDSGAFDIVITTGRPKE